MSDRFGRLTGTFHFVVDWLSAPPAHSTTYDAELWEVVKEPTS